jgi:Protein of unknown function (DUF3723)
MSNPSSQNFPPSSQIFPDSDDVEIEEKADVDDDAPVIDLELTADVVHSVEAELHKQFVGIVCLWFDQVDTDWTKSLGNPPNVRNRPLDATGVARLYDDFELKGVLRNHTRNHLTASSDEKNIMFLLTTLNDSGHFWTKVDNPDFETLREKLRLVNAQATWPMASVSQIPALENLKRLTLQAGQHRFTALQKVKRKTEADKWWPVAIYLEPLSPPAYTYIRENAKITQLALSDGERFNMVLNINSNIEHAKAQVAMLPKSDSRREKWIKKQKDYEESVKLLMTEGNTKNSRLISLLKRESLCQAISKGLRISALARDFTFGAMGEILSWRITDVLPLIISSLPFCFHFHSDH